MEDAHQDTSLFGCMKSAWLQSEGNLPGNKRIVIYLVSIPILGVPASQLLKYSPLDIPAARAALIGVFLLAASLERVHTSYLLKVLPGIINRDRLDAGFKAFGIIGFMVGLVVLSVLLMIGGF